MPKKLDPAVDKMLGTIYNATQLAAAKAIASGEEEVRTKPFRKNELPEKKEVPEAFKKRHRAKRVVKSNTNEVFAFMATNIDGGLTRQQSIAAAVDKFGVSKHSAGYHFDKAAGKR